MNQPTTNRPEEVTEMTVTDMVQEVVADLAPDSGWEVVDEATLLTPNGHEIEWDGISPDGEESILIQLGLV